MVEKIDIGNILVGAAVGFVAGVLLQSVIEDKDFGFLSDKDKKL